MCLPEREVCNENLPSQGKSPPSEGHSSLLAGRQQPVTSRQRRSRTDVSLSIQFAKLYTWEEFLQLGSDVPESSVDERIDNCKPGSCATLIYTSGTTVRSQCLSHPQGEPKGVMCSHDNCMFQVANIRYYIQLNDEDRFVSFLPMNHIAAQFVDTMLPVRNRITMYLARPDALRGTLVATLQKARPTFFVAVPRVYEKFMEAIRASNAQASVDDTV